MKHSLSDTRSPEKIQIEADLALQIEVYLASHDPIRASPIRPATVADLKPAVFTISKRRA